MREKKKKLRNRERNSVENVRQKRQNEPTTCIQQWRSIEWTIIVRNSKSSKDVSDIIRKYSIDGRVPIN